MPFKNWTALDHSNNGSAWYLDSSFILKLLVTFLDHNKNSKFILCFWMSLDLSYQISSCFEDSFNSVDWNSFGELQTGQVPIFLQKNQK